MLDLFLHNKISTSTSLSNSEKRCKHTREKHIGLNWSRQTSSIKSVVQRPRKSAPFSYGPMRSYSHSNSEYNHIGLMARSVNDSPRGRQLAKKDVPQVMPRVIRIKKKYSLQSARVGQRGPTINERGAEWESDAWTSWKESMVKHSLGASRHWWRLYW